MKFSALYKTYKAMAAPSWELTVGGAKLTGGDGAALLRADCRLTCRQEAGSLVLECQVDPDRADGRSWLDAMQPGAVCSFSLGYGKSLTEVFSGYLSDMAWDVPLDRGAMDLEAVFLDARGQLMNTSHVDAGTARTLSQMVRGVLNGEECKRLASRVTVKDVPGDWDLASLRRGQSDYEAVRAAASLLSYEFYACAGELYFGPARPETSPVLEFDGPDGLRRLQRRRSLAGQWGALEVSGADDNGERISYRKARGSDNGYGSKKLSGALTGERRVPAPGARTMAQIQYLANARMRERERQGGGLWGWSVGLPQIRPGRFVKAENIHSAVDGTWYVHTVHHTLDDIGFETYFETEGP